MKVKILGAHNFESQDTGFISILVDGVLAIDAGGLTSNLPLDSQQKIGAILLTHHHYDHIRDIPAIAMNCFLRNASIPVYSTQTVYDTLKTCLLNNRLYPDFFTRPPDKPTVRFTLLEPYKVTKIGDYQALPVPVHHAVPTVGYQVTAADGKSLFYTADTGPGLTDCWQRISPQLLIIEVTGPNRNQPGFLESGHLAPALLEQELAEFRRIRGYLPEVVTVHMNPLLEKEIEAELAPVAGRLGIPITPAFEGMEIVL